MFVQVIEGRTTDPQRLEACFDRWREELQPGAIGYVGSTEGISDDGRVLIMARFSDRDAAMANAQRPEQSAWWSEVEACLDGSVEFHETEDITEMRHGDPQQAGFVQVMEGHFTDRQRAGELEQLTDSTLESTRPDLLGATTAYGDDGWYATVAYFTNEEEARRNETLPVPDDLSGQFEEWERVMPVERYIDLHHPILIRA